MNMIRFNQFLNEASGGKEAGRMELLSTDVHTARAYAEKKIPDLDTSIPNFDKNYAIAQGSARYGLANRRDMPVITSRDVHEFQRRLKSGEIDINRPFSPRTNDVNPFPMGLSGKLADEFLINGIHDGTIKDDRIKTSTGKVKVSTLKMLQKQVYVDTTIDGMVVGGRSVAASRAFLESKTYFIISEDGYILDGHHRFLSAVLIDPNMKVGVLKIGLPIAKLWPVSLAYSDAVGNERNK